MALEVAPEQLAVCCRCATRYPTLQKGFYSTYAASWKGLGRIPICKHCITDMYNSYLSQCGQVEQAVRQMCRKLDLYWSDNVFKRAAAKGTVRTIMPEYIKVLNTPTYQGRSYDDTLREEGLLWVFDLTVEQSPEGSEGEDGVVEESSDENKKDEVVTLSIPIEVTKDIVDYWGSGFTKQTYQMLEQRKRYYEKRLPEDKKLDVGTEALLRQLCHLDIEMNRDRSEGKDVTKSVTAYNTILGSLNLKPEQQVKQERDKAMEETPFGVWINRWENERPVPEPDPDFEDKDGVIKYISTWFFGHLAKMVGVENAYSKQYEKEMSRVKLEHPDYDELDDEEIFNEVFSDNENEEEDIDDDSD
jgi:hypothetical protein